MSIMTWHVHTSGHADTEEHKSCISLVVKLEFEQNTHLSPVHTIHILASYTTRLQR